MCLPHVHFRDIVSPMRGHRRDACHITVHNGDPRVTVLTWGRAYGLSLCRKGGPRQRTQGDRAAVGGKAHTPRDGWERTPQNASCPVAQVALWERYYILFNTPRLTSCS